MKLGKNEVRMTSNRSYKMVLTISSPFAKSFKSVGVRDGGRCYTNACINCEWKIRIQPFPSRVMIDFGEMFGKDAEFNGPDVPRGRSRAAKLGCGGPLNTFYKLLSTRSFQQDTKCIAMIWNNI